MRYILVLYAIKQSLMKDDEIYNVNHAIQTWSYDRWRSAVDGMVNFNCDDIAEKIRKEVGNLAEPVCRRAPVNSTERVYLTVHTTYENAAKVLPRLICIAEENDLVLFDKETGKSYYHSLADYSFLAVKPRLAELKNAILKEVRPVWQYRKLEKEITEEISGGKYNFTYLVTLRKDLSKNFLTRCEEFYECLKRNLLPSEKLITQNESFIISSDYYSITYCLEGYKKHSNKMGFYLNGVPQEKLLNRISCEESFRWMKDNLNNQHEVDDIFDRMHFYEMEETYPNPADRFAASVKISKWQKRQFFEIRYCGIGYYGGEVLFYRVPEEEREYGKRSVLALGYTAEYFILPFVQEFYPYIYERYYEDNHIPRQMLRKIVERIKWAKEMVLYHTESEEFLHYLEGFHFRLLNGAKPLQGKNELSDIEKLKACRYEIASLYDAFIQWSEIQLKNCYAEEGVIFNIQGP